MSYSRTNADQGGPTMHGTTVLGVRRAHEVAIAADGQLTLGEIVLKANANKLRRLHHDKVIAGFAGAVTDAFTLFERFEAKLEEHKGRLAHAAVALAQDWRTDRYLRRLEASLLVADHEVLLLVSGNGEVIEPEGGVGAIGSGGAYALAAARALAQETEMGAEAIARASMGIAGDLCIYTNREIRVEVLEW